MASMKTRGAKPAAMAHVAVRSGRANIAVTVAGEGRLVVMLHAGFCDRRMWWGQLGGLGDRYRLAAYDRRGFGESSPASAQHTQVRDLDAVLEGLDADSAVLVASSDACRIALEYGLAHPDRVEGMVLMSPALVGPPPADNQTDVVQRLLDEMELARLSGDAAWSSRLMAQAWLDGPAGPEGRVAGNTRLLFLDMSEGALRRADANRDTLSGDPYRRFRYLTQPTAIVGGALDFSDVLERGRLLAAAGRQAQLYLMKGVAHLPGLEAPGRVNTLLARLIKTM